MREGREDKLLKYKVFKLILKVFYFRKQRF